MIKVGNEEYDGIRFPVEELAGKSQVDVPGFVEFFRLNKDGEVDSVAFKRVQALTAEEADAVAHYHTHAAEAHTKYAAQARHLAEQARAKP